MKTFKKDTLNLKENIYWLTWVKWLFSLTIFFVVLFNNNISLEEIHLGKSINFIRTIPNSDLFLYFLFGLLSILVISLYDFLWFHFNPIEIKTGLILKTSFIANSINNFISLGGISGSIVRFIFYRNSKINDSNLTKLNILLFPSFFTGLSVLMILSLINIGNIKYIYLNPIIVFIIITISIIYLLIYFFSEFIPIDSVKVKLREWGFIGNLKLKIFMILISSLDWLCASLFLWFISLHFNQNMAFLDLLFFFSFAYAVGINSSIPASLGVFDTLMILGLNSLKLNITESLSIVIIYRIFYYVLPFVISISLTTYELSTKGNGFFQLKNMKDIVIELEKSIRLSQKQQDFFKDILAFLFEIFILLASVLIITTSIIPSLSERINLIGKFVSIDILAFSQKISFIIGVLLFVLTYDIKSRLRSTYYVTLFLLGISTIFTVLKGLNIEECLILMVITYAFKYTKKHFYRISIPFYWPKVIKEMVISQAIIIIYVLSGQLNKGSFYSSHRGIELLYMTPHDYINNGIIFTILIQSFIILWNFLGHLRSMKVVPWANQTEAFVYENLDSFLTKYKGSMLSHLVYNGDKYIYISKDNNMLISFKPFYNKAIVLGDPIGNPENIVNNFDEFRIFIDIYGYTPVYYQISEKFMPEFHETGYAFFKLGEDAIINLSTYNSNHKNQKEFNHIIKIIEEKNWRFEMFYPPHSDAIIENLKKVSDEWLDGKKEKGFSLGFFDKDFLNKNPIACLCSPENEIVAFTSLITIYEKELFSVDLIRFSTRAPKSSMDYLFLKLFGWGLSQGFQGFYFGMAPLFNVGTSKYARKKEKIAKIVFNNLKITYNFEGLYKYKNKFNPTWESKYLAYPKNMRVEFILLTIILLISTKKKRVLKK